MRGTLALLPLLAAPAAHADVGLELVDKVGAHRFAIQSEADFESPNGWGPVVGLELRAPLSIGITPSVGADFGQFHGQYVDMGVSRVRERVVSVTARLAVDIGHVAYVGIGTGRTFLFTNDSSSSDSGWRHEAFVGAKLWHDKHCSLEISLGVAQTQLGVDFSIVQGGVAAMFAQRL